jgi:hypothetical protein
MVPPITRAHCGRAGRTQASMASHAEAKMKTRIRILTVVSYLCATGAVYLYTDSLRATAVFGLVVLAVFLLLMAIALTDA